MHPGFKTYSACFEKLHIGSEFIGQTFRYHSYRLFVHEALLILWQLLDYLMTESNFEFSFSHDEYEEWGITLLTNNLILDELFGLHANNDVLHLSFGDWLHERHLLQKLNRLFFGSSLCVAQHFLVVLLGQREELAVGDAFYRCVSSVILVQQS